MPFLACKGMETEHCELLQIETDLEYALMARDTSIALVAKESIVPLMRDSSVKIFVADAEPEPEPQDAVDNELLDESTESLSVRRPRLATRLPNVAAVNKQRSVCRSRIASCRADQAQTSPWRLT